MQIELNYSYEVDEIEEYRQWFLRTFGASQRNARATRADKKSHLAFILLGAAIICVLFRESATFASRGPLESIPYLLLLVFYGLLFYYIHFPKSTAIEILNSNPDLAKPMRVLLTDDGITIHYSTANNFMQWAHFVSATESKNLHLLVPDPKSGALILPKRAFPSPAALDEFRAFVQAHIGNTPIGFPVLPAQSTTQSKIEN